MAEAHRGARAGDARPFARYVLLLELGLGGGRSCHKACEDCDWAPEYHYYAGYAHNYHTCGSNCKTETRTVGGYHGRTFGALALTRSKTIYSEGVSPLMVSFPFSMRTCQPYLPCTGNSSPACTLLPIPTGTSSAFRPPRPRRRLFVNLSTSSTSFSRSRLTPLKLPRSSSSPSSVRADTSPLLRLTSKD